MTETETFEVPAIAEIPVPSKPPIEDEREVIIRASALVDKYEKERQQLEVMLTEATLGIEARNRTIENCKLELAEARNNLCTVQSTCETLRQEVSDCRALFSSLRAQLDHFEIPLPVRRKVKNGKSIAA
jgi:chromosome segregation ATPase